MIGRLRDLRRGWDELPVRDGALVQRASAAWEQGAAEHGWTYQPAAPELAGRYQPVFTTGAERYRYLLTTQLHGLRVQAFENHTFQQGEHGGDALNSHRRFIVLQLPAGGRPRL